MAEFAEVMQQANRMCASHEECSGCLASDVCVFDTCILKSPIEVLNHEKFERITINWAKEHLEPQYPTWKEWQQANFPNNSSPIYPCEFMRRSNMYCFNFLGLGGCGACANQPIPADIAEKLGIKPKEA